MAKYHISNDLEKVIIGNLPEPLAQRYITYIKENGDFPSEAQNFSNNLSNQGFGDKDYKKSIIPVSELSKKDISNQTDQELQGRLKTFQEAGTAGIAAKRPRNELVDYVYSGLRPAIVGSNEMVTRVSGEIADKIISGEIVNQNDLKGYFDKNNFDASKTDRFTNSVWSGLDQRKIPLQDYRGTKSSDYSSSIKEIKDIVGARTVKSKKEGLVSDYLSSLPSQLKTSREDFLKGEIQRAASTFQEQIVPRSLESLNTSGAIYSGNREDLLSTQAFDIQSQLNSQKFQLEQKDNEFYFNAAYQNKVRELAESSTNLANSLDVERGRVLTQNEQSFQAQQSNLNRTLQGKLDQRSADRQFYAEQNRMYRQQQQRQRDYDRQQYGQAGQIVGTTIGGIAGYAAGGPAGAYIGSNVGGQLGRSEEETV